MRFVPRIGSAEPLAVSGWQGNGTSMMDCGGAGSSRREGRSIAMGMCGERRRCSRSWTNSQTGEEYQHVRDMLGRPWRRGCEGRKTDDPIATKGRAARVC